jgi:hypothetical protein
MSQSDDDEKMAPASVGFSSEESEAEEDQYVGKYSNRQTIKCYCLLFKHRKRLSRPK